MKGKKHQEKYCKSCNIKLKWYIKTGFCRKCYYENYRKENPITEEGRKKRNESAKKYYYKNKDVIKSKMKGYSKEFYQKNKERLDKINIEYYRKNKEKIHKRNRENYHKRKKLVIQDV